MVVKAGAIALLVAVIGGTALTLQPDDGPDPVDAAADLDGAAKELVDLLEADRQATFHARYEVSSPDFAGASVAFETWRRPPSVRSDIEVTRPEGIVRTRQLVLETGAMACQQSDDGPWQCASTPDAKDPFEGSIRDQVAAAESVSAEDRTIDGRDVRCFTLQQTDLAAEFCATDDGIPVLVDSAGTTLRLVSLDREVGDVFTPPAELVG